MIQSKITIDVVLDEDKVPLDIQWNATGSTAENGHKAKGMMMALWDGEEKTAMRIDLWTKDMMVDEMTDFFYQTMITMADTYKRATQNEALSGDIKQFAAAFIKKFKETQPKL